MTCLCTDVDVELPESGPPTWAAAAAKLRELGAEALAKRIQERAERLL